MSVTPRTVCHDRAVTSDRRNKRPENVMEKRPTQPYAEMQPVGGSRVPAGRKPDSQRHTHAPVEAGWGHDRKDQRNRHRMLGASK